METTLYFVRHAESAFVEGKERTRGLTEQGLKDAHTIRDILRSENIDVFVSSPYERSIETIRLTAVQQGKNIHIEEDLRERKIGDFTPVTFKEAKRHVYEDLFFCFPGGESSLVAQSRAIEVIKRIIETNKGKRIVIGTHGDIMTLMLNYFDNQFGYIFWESTSMPDIYKLRFAENELIDVTRMWDSSDEGKGIS
jgi:2,3-bisphosphoglycerate-dependent phosphoglycerate mutase